MIRKLLAKMSHCACYLYRVNNFTTHLWVLAFVDVALSLNYTFDCPVHVTLCTRKDPAQIITHFTGALGTIHILRKH